MKVLLINGSPRSNGNTFTALKEVAGALEAEGVETEIVPIGANAVQGCIACRKCAELGRCVFNDGLYNSIWEKLRTADGIVIGSPVYYAGPNGSLCALLDRLFYSASQLLEYKPAAAVAVCRRGGASAALDRLNKYFSINNMPVVSSRYWNIAYGSQPGEAGPGCRGHADHAHSRPQHGLGAERPEDAVPARERARRQDQLRPIVSKRRNP